MSLDDIDEFFNNELNEIDNRTCLFLIAAAEAVLVVDFLNRVGGRKKDTISKNFKDIFKKNTRKTKKKSDLINIFSISDGTEMVRQNP
jgi:hypothetical protein